MNWYSLFAIEHPKQIGLAIKLSTEVSNPLFLALTPQVSYALSRRGVDHSVPEDFHTEDDINDLGNEILEKLDSFCAEADSVVRRNTSAIAVRGLDVGSLAWYELKLVVNSLAIKSYIFARIIQSWSIERVYCYDSPEESISPNLFFYKESVWSKVIYQACWDRGLPISTYGELEHPNVIMPASQRDLNIRQRLRAISKSLLGEKASDALVEIAKRYRGMYLGDRSTKTIDPSKPCILTLDTSYSLRETIRLIEGEGRLRAGYLAIRDTGACDLYWLAGERHIRDKAYQSGGATDKIRISAWEEVEKSDSYRSLAAVGNLHLGPLLQRRLKFYFDEVVPCIVQVFDRVQSLFRELKPVAIIGTAMSWLTKTVYEAAKNASIPTIVFRHGASGGYMMMNSAAPFIHYQNELRWADYVFTFGEGDNRYYNAFYPKKKAQTVAIGSAILDDLRRQIKRASRERLAKKFGLDPQRPIAIYCPTSMDGNMRAAPNRSRSPERSFRIEQEIAHIAGEIPHVQCIFKLHVASPYWPVSPIGDYIRDKQLENCIVITADLKVLLPVADFFITDYPSTTFLEMLVTEKPILVCGHLLPFPFNRETWHPSRLEMWRERVRYFEELDDFLQGLRSYLQAGCFSPVRSDDTLLKLFGTHLDDGNSARRAVDEIYRITEAKLEPRSCPLG
jgi:hypothetical protein